MNDAEPAFPGGTREVRAGYRDVYEGMSLRDWFAGQALRSLIMIAAFNNNPDRQPHGMTTKSEVASNCYKYADAMIAQRAKGEK